MRRILGALILGLVTIGPFVHILIYSYNLNGIYEVKRVLFMFSMSLLLGCSGALGLGLLFYDECNR